MSNKILHSTVSIWRTLSASFLVAGACVGGGMLALPVDTALAGFFPSLVVMTIAYLFMMVTGLLIIEITLWLEEGAHFMTMSSKLFGRFGKFCTIIIYLFMGYASLIAYNSAGSVLIENAFTSIFEISLSKWQSGSLFALVFGSMLYLGTKYIGRINTFLMVGMVLSYILLTSVGVSHIQFERLKHMKWGESLFSFPLLLAIFSYQMMVPSLTPYLKRDPRALKTAVILGLSIPFLVYLIWQWIILGSIPLEGNYGLERALREGRTATDALKNFVSSPYLSFSAQFFAFFALVTSYLGIGLGLKDFLSDLFKVKKSAFGFFVMGALTVIPSLIFGVTYPRAFLIGLEVSGGFGDAFLSSLFPVCMVWIGRYVKKNEGPFVVFGGKPLLSILALISIFIVGVQIVKLILP